MRTCEERAQKPRFKLERLPQAQYSVHGINGIPCGACYTSPHWVTLLRILSGVARVGVCGSALVCLVLWTAVVVVADITQRTAGEALMC